MKKATKIEDSNSLLIIIWNVTSLRSAWYNGLIHAVLKIKPDIFPIQQTRVNDSIPEEFSKFLMQGCYCWFSVQNKRV
jgi:exonuclease III